MKVWLNDLKEGDIFYHIIFNNVYKCRHLGNANNLNYRMPRIKFEILEDKHEALGNEHEAFVNQDVYDDYESAIKALKETLEKNLEFTLKSIILKKHELEDLENESERLKKLIKNIQNKI